MQELMAQVEQVLVAAGVGGVGSVPAEALRGIMEEAGLARLDRAVPGWRGVICAVVPYYVEATPPESALPPMARYAWGADYHGVLGEMLEKGCAVLRAAGCQAAAYVDASPIPEVRTAAVCGLGVIGRNGLLLTQDWGSWVFIGCIVTDAALPFGPVREIRHCIGCGACVRACPGGALRDGKVDSASCLSALSQRGGELTEGEAAQLRKNRVIWGCDRCQEVCPANRHVQETAAAAFREELLYTLPIEAMGCSSRREFCTKWPGRAFTWKGLRVVQRNLGLFAQEVPAKFV